MLCSEVENEDTFADKIRQIRRQSSFWLWTTAHKYVH